MAESYGWTGKILRVDLTTGEIATQDDAKYHKVYRRYGHGLPHHV